MLVEVVELNCRGHRRPRSEWRQAAPIRAELSMLKYFSWHGHENAPVFATLRPYLLESLDRAKVLHLAGRNIVIMGQQRVREGTFEQVWWCRIVSDDAPDDAVWTDLLRRLSSHDHVESCEPF